jgi:hypothetical protein
MWLVDRALVQVESGPMRLMEASALSSGPAACVPAISPSGQGAAQDVSTWETCARAAERWRDSTST